jgi:hypothetical protein
MVAIFEGNMNEQLALTLLAASAGFIAAVFFCVGNALNSAKNIALQSSAFWGANLSLARALAVQRSQYVAGALLLVTAFALQIWAALTSSTSLAALPPGIDTWLRLVLIGVATTGFLGLATAAAVYRTTMRKVERLLEGKG